ncbi:MAG: lysine 2,3-aminomutase, partial [Gammaproteobacteria bacterium]
MPRVLTVVDPSSVGAVSATTGPGQAPALLPVNQEPASQSPVSHGRVNLTPVPTTRPTIPRLTVSTRSDAFRRRFYPQAGLRDWNDWRWQNRSRIRALADLERMFQLTDDERQAVENHKGALPVGITPYYASLVDPENPAQGLRRTVVPAMGEYLRSRGEADDPLGEDAHSPVPGLV